MLIRICSAASLVCAVLFLSACESAQFAEDREGKTEARFSIPNADEWIANNEVRTRFRSRASVAEYVHFEQLASSKHAAKRTQALELVLLKLTNEELFALEITETGKPGSLMWSVAWSLDSDEILTLVGDILDKSAGGSSGSIDLGHCGWYVHRDKFFVSRAALMHNPDVQRLGVLVVTPKLPMPAHSSGGNPTVGPGTIP